MFYNTLGSFGNTYFYKVVYYIYSVFIYTPLLRKVSLYFLRHSSCLAIAREVGVGLPLGVVSRKPLLRSKKAGLSGIGGPRGKFSIGSIKHCLRSRRYSTSQGCNGTLVSVDIFVCCAIVYIF